MPKPTETKPDPKNQLAKIIQERIRQASLSFNLSLLATAASAVVSLTGAGLLLRGNLSEGALTAASGAGSTVYCIKLAKDANDRLDRIFEELND
ncbi:TRADD-N-associated membrane domain-containing protein [Chamaesiphon sp. OTE_75_metabat_556]|uniref:TRADD-N-associated membrane domain-containing protein n=1 Tax=Chamaesiphon sp. OTE_75_metabat_556 TaxID=2964692 RepID=UPI00286D6139|nr:hypothetical protein [Chamaesiphon sp. OTE_75_metabat_556]